jgi:transporter family protein
MIFQSDSSSRDYFMSIYLALLALIISALYGGYNLFIKLSSEHIDHVLGAAILQNASLIFGLAILIYFQVQGKLIKVTSSGVTFSIVAGLFVGLAEILSFYFLEKVDASQGIPIIIGGSVLAGSILGIVILHETLSFSKMMGILFIILGILIVSIDVEKLVNYFQSSILKLIF